MGLNNMGLNNTASARHCDFLAASFWPTKKRQVLRPVVAWGHTPVFVLTPIIRAKPSVD
jgi:hypothetical protein